MNGVNETFTRGSFVFSVFCIQLCRFIPDSLGYNYPTECINVRQMIV